jgi:hypothetical protein
MQALRDQQSGIPGNTRDQALALNRSLREALGETVLAPRIVDGSGAPAVASSARTKPALASATPPAGAASAAAAAATAAKAKAKPKL